MRAGAYLSDAALAPPVPVEEVDWGVYRNPYIPATQKKVGHGYQEESEEGEAVGGGDDGGRVLARAWEECLYVDDGMWERFGECFGLIYTKECLYCMFYVAMGVRQASTLPIPPTGLSLHQSILHTYINTY